MNDISDKSSLLVGIIDDVNEGKNDKEIKENIFVVNVNNGSKFSSKKEFESFLDFGDIKEGINYVYIIIKEKLVYDLNKKVTFDFMLRLI